jgi:hypothetical protein
LLLSIGTVSLASCVDGVADPVGEQFVLFGAALLEVVGDAGGDGVAGDLLTSPPGKQFDILLRVNAEES